MEAFLQITTPYYVSPQKLVFALWGTGLHENLESFSEDGEISEQKIDDKVSGGTPDHLEIDEEGDGTSYVLYDYKGYGSFSVAKLLEKYVDEEVVKDVDGRVKLITRGPNKGSMSINKIIRCSGPMVVPPESDLSMQVNRYRRMLEDRGKKISRMACQIVVRDGNTQMAKKRGVCDEAYMVDIPFVEDAMVDDFFANKSAKLVEAVKSGSCSEICTAEERWDEDNKCRSVCKVWFACPHGRAVRGEVDANS
jgi:hypothetical protein